MLYFDDSHIGGSHIGGSHTGDSYWHLLIVSHPGREAKEPVKSEGIDVGQRK